VIFRQLIHEDLGCASYLIGDEKADVAAVVDPRFEVDGYLELARYLGVGIEHVFETHNHADHVSGHGRLVAATGATIHVHRLAEPAYDHEPFDDGARWELGALLVEAVHTPGHRPEHTAFALTDTRRGADPWALLSGDSLFVNDVGRPDLAIEPADGARGIFRSLHGRLLRLPDAVELWPGHLGGSLCGGPGMDLKVSSTIGFERAHTAALAIGDEDEFVATALAGLGPQPPNFQAIVDLNRGPLLTAGVEVLPLAPRQLGLAQDQGALVVDVRTDQQFDDAHIPGSISIPMLRAGFGSRLAWLADRDQETAFVGRDDADGRHAAELAVAVGIRRLAGFLHGGFTSWRQERRFVGRVERLAIEDLAARRDDEPGLVLLDVRERSEWDAGHIPGSVWIPWHELREAPAALDLERPVAVLCSSGRRAGTAASLLQHHGARRVLHVVDGGVPTWGRLGHPVESAA